MNRDESLDRTLAEALRAGPDSPCPGEEALLDFFGGRVSDAESEAIREHLARCGPCVALARDAREFLGAFEPEGRAWRPLRPALAAAAALAAIALAGLFVARGRPSPPPRPAPEPAAAAPAKRWRNLEVAPAPYRPAAPEDELVYRSGEPPRGDGFFEAMAPYVRADYAAADVALARFLQTHPGHAEATFYRGVSLLMTGRLAEAKAHLESASRSPHPPAEARWYLALALLKGGDANGSLASLDAVAREPGPHRAEAAELSREIRHGLGVR